MSNLISNLKAQRKLELSHIKTLTPEAEKIGHPLARLILESIIHDSGKHASICEGLIAVEAGQVPLKLDMDMASAINLHQDIKQHVRVEQEMIDKLEAMIEEAKDDRVADLLRYMLEDEKRHHSLLTGLSNLVDRDDAAYDEYMKLFQTFMIVPP
jgi:rubrerythrin